MTIQVDIPDDLVSTLGDNPGAQGRLVREALAVHLYRESKLSLRAMGRMAGVGEDFWSADAFRERHRLPVQVAEPSDEDEALEWLRKQG